MRDGDAKYTLISRGITFYTSEKYILVNDKPVKLDIPDDSDLSGLLNDQLLVTLKSDWTVNGTTYKQGDLVSLDFSELLAGRKSIQVVFHPDEFTSISG